MDDNFVLKFQKFKVITETFKQENILNYKLWRFAFLLQAAHLIKSTMN